jgi:hypothetical protein
MAAKKRTVIGRVDTHARTHHATALDPTGQLLGDAQFPATTAGYAALLAWLRRFALAGLAAAAFMPATPPAAAAPHAPG